MTEYDAQVRAFLDRFGVKLTIAKRSSASPPPWADDDRPRDRYLVTMTRDGRSYSWSWWNSVAATVRGEEPTAYDVLAGERADADLTADDVYDEFGGDLRPSRYEAIAQHARELARVLNDSDCIDALHEIQ